MLEAVGIVYLCALAGVAIGLAVSPGHSFSGKAASLTIYGLIVTGTILAVRTLYGHA